MMKVLESIWMKFLLINPITEYALLFFSWIWSLKVKCESYRIPRSLIWTTFCILLTESVLLMWYAVSVLSLEVSRHAKRETADWVLHAVSLKPDRIAVGERVCVRHIWSICAFDQMCWTSSKCAFDQSPNHDSNRKPNLVDEFNSESSDLKLGDLKLIVPDPGITNKY